MKGKHHYKVSVEWTGNTGAGTAGYAAYSRDHRFRAAGMPDVPGSSDPAFRGDPARWNPEDMLVASLSACHKLWYLHFCAVEGVTVQAYRDEAEGVMVEDPKRGGAFALVTLKPQVTIAAGGDAALAQALHERAHHFCFIANSVNFPVRCEPRIVIQSAS
ncbi:MAG: OsmC family protein [Achromobacter mucicolens]